MATFKTKYNIGDTVYIIWRNHLNKIKIGGVHIHSGGVIFKDTEVFYVPDWTYSPFFALISTFDKRFKESDVFSSLDDAVKNIKV